MTRVNTNIFGRLEVNNKPSDYAISGALGTSIIDGGLNYQKYKEGKISKEDAVKKTVKSSTQVAIAAGSSVACIQYLANKNYLGAILSTAAGIGAVVAIEKICKSKKEEENGN